jgi:hypothetical protein
MSDFTIGKKADWEADYDAWRTGHYINEYTNAGAGASDPPEGGEAMVIWDVCVNNSP